MDYEDPATDSAGIGRWGLMGWGAQDWNGDDGPNPFCAWSLMQLGWMGHDNDRLVEVVVDMGRRVEDLYTGGSVYRIPLRILPIDGSRIWRDYLLLERRTRSGTYYNRHLPGEGLLIWHVRTRALDNNDEQHKRIDLICADGLYQDAGFPAGQEADPQKGRDNLDFWAHDPAYAREHVGNLGDASDLFDGSSMAGAIEGERLTAWREGGQLHAWLEAHPDQQAVDRLPIQGSDDRIHFWSLRIVALPAAYPGERLVVLEDETRQRLLEQQLLQAEKLTSLGEMAAGVAHEIKNPLAIMQNACDLLKRLKPEQREEQERVIGSLQGAIQRVNGRIGDLLDFARPGRQEREPVAVVALLRQLLELERQQLQEAGIQVQEDLQEVPRVYVNLDLLKDICLNLIINAREAMPRGGELGIVTRLAGNQVLLRVRDTGVGIAPEHRDRIFEPFYSTKPTGYGLGLAISYRQLQEIGGRIEVQSQEGVGSTFSVYLPRAVGKEERS